MTGFNSLRELEVFLRVFQGLLSPLKALFRFNSLRELEVFLHMKVSCLRFTLYSFNSLRELEVFLLVRMSVEKIERLLAAFQFPTGIRGFSTLFWMKME